MLRILRQTGGKRRAQSGMTLVELLIGMTVTTVLTAMILVSWFALSRSYSYSIQSSEARDNARFALSRMAREIRDAENNPAVSETAIRRARARWIEFYTTFNESGNTDPTSTPHLVMFRLYPDQELWRYEDTDGSGTIANVSESVSDWPGLNVLNVSEQANGEGARMLCDHIVNDIVPSKTDPTALFEYARYDTTGSLYLEPVVLGNNADNRQAIVSVQIHLLADVNPARSPTYADLQTTAQLRNSR